MPVLSVPIPIPGAEGGPMWIPLRIPFPITRIGSILPSSINEPFKSSLLALFRLAWSNKVQLPVLITVCFMAFDIRMQLEINFFWETPRPTVPRQRRQHERGGTVSNVNQGALQAAAITAALLASQRQRIQLQRERARQQELTGDLNGGRHNYPAVQSGLSEEDDDEYDTDTDTLEDDHGSVTGGQEGTGKLSNSRRKRKRRLGGPNDEEDEDEDSEEEDSDEDDDDDSSDDDDNDDDGASSNPGFFGSSNGDRDYFSEDEHSNDGDGSSDDDSNEGGTPLVVQLEIHQRAGAAFSDLSNKLYSAVTSISISSFNFLRSLKRETVPLKKSCNVVELETSNLLDSLTLDLDSENSVLSDS